MKVRCINNRNLPIGEDCFLTLNNIYEVVEEKKEEYKIVANYGRRILYNKDRFEIVKEDKEMKFKVGDKVRVREDLEINKMHGNYEFIKEMAHLKGEIVTIKEVLKSGYRIEEEYYMWTDEMLEEVKENKMDFKTILTDIEKEFEKAKDLQELEYHYDGITDHIYCLYQSKYEKLQRKKYSFEEALKAYEEGKEIESCYSEIRYKKIDSERYK